MRHLFCSNYLKIVIKYTDFILRFEENEDIINGLFPKDKVAVMSIVRVESTYLLSSLTLLGYDYSHLYNVGGFFNSLTTFASYRETKDFKYKIMPPKVENLK